MTSMQQDCGQQCQHRQGEPDPQPLTARAGKSPGPMSRWSSRRDATVSGSRRSTACRFVTTVVVAVKEHNQGPTRKRRCNSKFDRRFCRPKLSMASDLAENVTIRIAAKPKTSLVPSRVRMSADAWQSKVILVPANGEWRRWRTINSAITNTLRIPNRHVRPSRN